MHRTFLFAAMPPIASIVVDDYLYPPPSSGSGGDLPEIPDAWYGNIQYLLWVYFVFVVIVVVIISAIESRLRFTRFRDGNGNISDPNANSTAVFTIMVQGLPKNLGSDRVEFEECFRQKYPGKVYKIIIPMDLCALDDLATELVLVRDEITWYGL